MGNLIDSSVLIAAQRGQIDLDSSLASYASGEVAISAVTASELLHGVHRARGTRFAADAEAFVNGLLDRIPVFDFDLRVARVHARIWAELQQSGAMIGERDLLIAATALAHEYGVLTRNLRDFARVPGLHAIEV